MARSSGSDELPIIRSHYELILWLTPKVGKFPREHRFTVGQRVERLLGEILEKLIRAKFTRDRREILESVNVDLEVLRFQISVKRSLPSFWKLLICFVPLFAVVGDKVAEKPQ